MLCPNYEEQVLPVRLCTVHITVLYISLNKSVTHVESLFSKNLIISRCIT